MLDFTEAAVVAWLRPIRSSTRQNSWPPAIRPIEREPGVEPLLHTLGTLLSEIADSDSSLLPEILMDDTIRDELQAVVAQLGAARLLRLIDCFAVTSPGWPQVLAHLIQGSSASAQAIRSSVRALTTRNTIIRMFSPDRVATVQSCAEAATDPQENS